MEYWISTNGVQSGPYTLEQLQEMWRTGELTADTYYFETIRAQWLLLQVLIESNRQLFTPQEAFVRLGQNRQSGCMVIYNKEEQIHLYADNGYIVHATGPKDQGELALAKALRLEDATFEWFLDVRSPESNLRVNVHDYALKHALTRDVHAAVAQPKSKVTKHTVALSNIGGNGRIEMKLSFVYVLVPEETPTVNYPLDKAMSVLGREEHCDLIVVDSRISRKHCLLETTEQNVKVKDLDSSNGTFVNRVPIQEGYLKVGDQLSLGSYSMTLRKEQKRAPQF